MTEQSLEPAMESSPTAETTEQALEPGHRADLPRALPSFYGRVGNVCALSAFAALGFVVLATTGSRWLSVLPLVLGLAFAARRVRPSSALSVRLASDLLEIAVALWVVAVSAGIPGWGAAVVGSTAVVVAALAEPPISRLAAGAFVPFVSNMPGLRPARPPLRQAKLFAWIGWGTLALGAVAVAAGLPPWVWLPVGLVAMVRPTAVLVRTVGRILAARRIEADVVRAMTDYQPEFVVYTARPDAAAYQVLMWLPYLARTGRRFVIIARTNTAAFAVAQGTDAPILTRRSISSLDGLVVPSLRASFYVNASSGNGAFVRHTRLTHVYLGHGDSDKAPSYNPTHAMYDKIFAAGPAAVDRYAAHGVFIPPERFEVVGRPQVEGIEQSRSENTEVVLYAPTWRGHVSETLLYSLPLGERIVAALLARGQTVIFRPHPFSYSFQEDRAVIERIQDLLRRDARLSGRRHVFGAAAESELSIVDCMNASHALVSDVSSVVSDYLFSGKPLAMVAVPCAPDAFVLEYPVATAAYVIDGALANLPTVLDDLLGADPRREERLAVRSRYLGDFPVEHYSQAFVDACSRVIETVKPSAGGVDDTIADKAAGRDSALARGRILFALYGRDFSLAAAALIAVLLLLGGAVLAASVVTGVVVAATLATAIPVGGVRAGLNHMLGTLVMPRAVLALGLFSGWAGTDLGVAVTTVSLMVLTTMLELPLRGGWGGPGSGVRNFAELADPPDSRLPRGTLAVANTLQLAFGWLLLALGASPAPLLASSLGCLAVGLTVLRATATRLEALDDIRLTLPSSIERYQPAFAVYFASTMGADYQIGMWLPYFRRIGSRFVVIVRDLLVLQQVAEFATDVPVIYRPSLRSLEDVIVPTMTTAFYVNNAVRNTHFIERRELTHVWLNHGDSEKPACFNPVHAIYDVIYAAGQAGIDRYARHGVIIPRHKFEIVGRPQVEQIMPARGPIASVENPTVLYAPTWRGPYADSRVYSLPRGEAIVKELLRRGMQVIFRWHPFNEQFAEDRAFIERIDRLLREDRRRTGREHRWGRTAQHDMSIEDCFNASDAMVADISAVLSDYLKSDKPFAIVSVGRTPAQLAADAPVAGAGYVIRDDLGNLETALDSLLGHDPLAAQRRDTKVYYLGDFPDARYADGFLAAARRTIATGHRPAVVDHQPEAESRSTDVDNRPRSVSN